ncbi:MAG: hypothetical protein HY737_07260 [Candidatus Omnitrophica bacterium]|nr:hypothetical protein [Candidatus Omnitrophota bacterium]
MRCRTVHGFVVIGVSGLLGVASSVGAAEHGGKEHGGAAHEHGGQAVSAEPSAEQIRQTIQQHVQGIATEQGTFSIDDPVTGTTRNLEFVRVHDRVGKTGDLYYSCTDMRDTQTGEVLDLDFDVEATGEQLKVVDQRIHKVEGQARYTYDEQDNRIPVSSPDSGALQ